MFLRTVSLCAVVTSTLHATPAWSQRDPSAPSNHVQAFERCQKIAGPIERLTCFDAAAATLVTATRRGDTTIVDRAEVRAVRRSLFGYQMPKLPFFRGDDTAADSGDILETRVTAVRSLGYGRFRITVADGGAIWDTTESDSTMDDPRPGQAIKLKRGALGRYLLSINGQRSVTGRRVT